MPSLDSTVHAGARAPRAPCTTVTQLRCANSSDCVRAAGWHMHTGCRIAVLRSVSGPAPVRPGCCLAAWAPILPSATAAPCLMLALLSLSRPSMAGQAALISAVSAWARVALLTACSQSASCGVVLAAASSASMPLKACSLRSCRGTVAAQPLIHWPQWRAEGTCLQCVPEGRLTQLMQPVVGASCCGRGLLPALSHLHRAWAETLGL